MKTKALALLLILSFVLSACQTTPTATQPAAAQPTAAQVEATKAPADNSSSFQIPDIEQGKFNVAFVYIGPHNDGGYSQAHDDGRMYVDQNVPNVHTAYIENVPEGADSEQVFRALSRKGFNVIFGTSFGFMDPMETVAADFPDITYIHVSGYKSNGTNFGNLFGGMESMKYLAGMLAGSRAKMDKITKLGYMATFPIPEETRLGNAFMLGARKTCPECTMDVRWINTWHDPVKEREASASLMDAGADVVLTGADTPAVADVATEKGKWGITYDYKGSCKAERCLTTPYWNWGPVYTRVIKGIQDKTYKVGWDYFDVDSGGLGLYGFMDGETPTKGVMELPKEDVQMVKDLLAQMKAGKFTRFDVFSGEIKDNQGKVVVPAGEKMVQADLDQFPPGAPGLECKYCMKWWAEGINAELPQ